MPFRAKNNTGVDEVMARRPKQQPAPTNTNVVDSRQLPLFEDAGKSEKSEDCAVGANDNGLDDDAIERISQRVAELLFHKIMRRVAKAAQVAETIKPPCKPRLKEPTPEVLAAVLARRARKGEF